jgi:hypothetical protein
MLLHYLRRLTSRNRTPDLNQHLARYFDFVAGVLNAGGFVAVRQYALHMSGVFSAMADDLALGCFSMVFVGSDRLIDRLWPFCSSTKIRWTRKRQLQSEYALPPTIEAALLWIFGPIGREFRGDVSMKKTCFLCFDGSSKRHDYEDVGCCDRDNALDGDVDRHWNRARTSCVYYGRG